jgi:hypothetical protein
MRDLFTLIMTVLYVLKHLFTPKKQQAGRVFEELCTKMAAKYIGPQEMEQVKKYSAMFGLDTGDVDVDITVILEMGQKYESYLGSEKFEELHAAIVQERVNRYFHVNPESRSAHHQINMVIKSHSARAVSFTLSFIKIATGGRKDGEPTSISSYTAA